MIAGGLEVLGLVATAKQSAVDLRMQGFHAAFHHLGKAGVLADLGDGQALLGEELGGAAGREQRVAVLFDESAGEIRQAAFVTH